MPMADDFNGGLIRAFLYGKAKTKKTQWALRAALAGFNVILLDGDKGAEVIKVMGLDPQTLRRIRVIECADKMTQPVFANLITKLLAGYTVRWDDKAQRVLPTGIVPIPEHGHFVIDLTKVTENDVLVLDSWSALHVSLGWQWFQENGMDVTIVDRKMDLRALFGYQSRLLNWMLVALKGLKCHVIVTGHEMINEITEPKLNDKGVVERVATGEVYTQISSSSRAHGGLLPKDFGDILYFNMHGSNYYIDTRAAEDRDGGSRHLQGEFEWSKLQVVDLCKILGIAGDPTADMPSCLYYKPGALGTNIKPAATTAGAGIHMPGMNIAKPALVLGNTPKVEPPKTLNITLNKPTGK